MMQPEKNTMKIDSTQRAQPLQKTPKRPEILKKLHSKPTVKGAVIALVVLLAIVLLSPFLSPQNPYDLGALDLMDGRLKPMSEAASGMTYWLGTDDQGRDMLSAILHGLRISLMVGLSAVVLATIIGSLVGLIAAYMGGWVDTLLMRIVDFILGTDKIDLSALDTDFDHLWIETAGTSNSVYVVQTPGEFNIETDLAISVAATTAGALTALDFIF